MDLLAFVTLAGVVTVRRDRKREIKNQEELIDDFEKWDEGLAIG